MSVVCLGRVFAAPDLVPGTVDITLRDSTGLNDSVHVNVHFKVIGDSTAPNSAQWTIVRLQIDGVNRMNGVVAPGLSLKTLPPGTVYLDSVNFFVTKEPHSMTVIFDPAGVSGETPANAGNNMTARTFNFHPIRIQDTVYTGPGCKVSP